MRWTGQRHLKLLMLTGSNDSLPATCIGYFQRFYTLAEEFCTELSQQVKGAGFFKTLLPRRIGSTMYAGHKTIEKLLNEWNTDADNELTASEDEDDA